MFRINLLETRNPTFLLIFSWIFSGHDKRCFRWTNIDQLSMDHFRWPIHNGKRNDLGTKKNKKIKFTKKKNNLHHLFDQRF